MLGLSNAPGAINNMQTGGATWDARYQYLTGGVNFAVPNNWTTWNSPPGQFATNYINESVSNGYLPVFTYYQIYPSYPAVGTSEAEKDYNNLNNPSTMNAYFADFKLLLDRIRLSGQRVLVHVEPDLWGFLQKRSTNPQTISAAVASSGYSDVAAYPNTVAGFAKALVGLRDKYAPGAILAYHISPWASLAGDVASNTSSSFDVTGAAQETAGFYNQTGANFDLLFYDISDRDAGYYASQGQLNRWWDTSNTSFPNFDRFNQFVSIVTAQTGKRGIIWQVPIGNTLYRSVNNTSHHWQDNRVQYYLGPDNNSELQELADAGIIGLLFGAGDPQMTGYDDAAGDGVTNPAPINGNNLVAVLTDDDGGYMRQRGAAYYSRGALALSSPPLNPILSVTPPPGSTLNLTGPTGTTANTALTITNTGPVGTSLIVSGPALAGSGAANFSLSLANGLNLSGGASQTITVSCIIPATGGYTATLNYATNDPNQLSISYNLSCGAPTLIAKFSSTPYASGGTIALASQQGQTSQAKLYIGNAGTQGSTLTVDAANLSQINPNVFSVSPSTGFSISYGASATSITVSCTPAGTGVQYGATLTYHTNDPILSTVTYNLVCNGLSSWTVTNPNDDGNGTSGSGTLSEALKNYSSNQIIVFAVPGNKITVTSQNSLLVNRGPVVIDGGNCANGTPSLTIDGNGLVPDGLELGGGVQLRNITIEGFTRRNLLSLRGGGNKIGSCVVLKH